MADELRARSCPDLVDRVDRWRAEAGLSRAEATKALVLRGLEISTDLEEIRQGQTTTHETLAQLETDHDELANGQDELENLVRFQLVDEPDRADRADDVDDVDQDDATDQDEAELEELPMAHVEPVDG